jgi:hypothetical protein
MFENIYLNFALVSAVCICLFALTLFFSIKKWITASTTFVLLIFSLLAGIALANVDLLRYHLTDYDYTYHAPDMELLISQFQEDSLHRYEELKTELEMQKQQTILLQQQLEKISNNE